MRIVVKIVRKEENTRSTLWIPIDFNDLDDLKNKLMEIKRVYGDDYEIEY